MMVSTALLLGLLAPFTIAAPAEASAAADPVLRADLDYGSFQGAYSSRYNISYWQKIPYAAPPTGQNRFRAPQPPAPVDGVYDSSKTFDMCPQRTVNGSEDCLYLGLYSRPWSPSSSRPLRPVIITFHGGGYVQGAASFSPPPSAYPILNVSSTTDLLFVYPSYRLNAFGFLAGKEVAVDPLSDTNVGLKDQRAVLKWTKKYIKAFGGDPDNVTVWGQSAGGGSVVAQVIAAPKDEDEPLFNKALASSPFWSKTYRHDSRESQAVYDTLADLTGCAGPDSLQCLKNVDVQKIRDASLIITDSHKWTTSSFTWGPVLDDDFLTTPLSEASASVRVASGFSMFNTHEGENFVPTNLTSLPPDDPLFHTWLSGYLPDLPDCAMAAVTKIYPPTGNFSALEAYTDAYTRAGLIYRDTVLSCPAYWMAGAGGKKWLGEYTIAPAKHASDVYWWNSINKAQVDDPLHYQGYAGAFASFFATGNPNALKLTADSVPGVPSLDSGDRWIIDPTGFDTTPLAELEERCNFWKKLAKKIPV